MLNKDYWQSCFNKYKQLLKQSILPEVQDCPLTIDAFQKLHARYSLSSFLTYRYADEGGIWLADNPIGMDSYLIGFEIAPLIMGGPKTTAHIETLLSRLPTGTIIYSIAHANADIHSYLDKWATARTFSSNRIYDLVTKRRTEYFIDWALGKINPVRGEHFRPRSMQYYWFIRIPSSYENFSSENCYAFNVEVEQVINKVFASTKAAGLGIKQLSGSDCVLTIRLLANLHQDPVDIHSRSVNLSMPVSPQIFSIDSYVKQESNGEIFINTVDENNSKYLRVLTAIGLPDTPFYLPMMANCIGSIYRPMSFIPGNFYAYSIMEVLDPESTKQKIIKKMAILQHQTASTSKWYQTVMQHLYIRGTHVENLYNAISKNGEKPIKAILGLVLSANSQAELEEATSIAKSEWDQANIQIHTESAIALPMWLTSLPGQFTPDKDGDVHGLQRGTTMAALNAATFSHVQGDWQGSSPKHGGLLLMSRRGVLTTFNVFESLSNYNGVMAAASGSGKSFTTNEMATDFLSRGGMVRIIDAGRSYYNAAEVMSGQNLVFKRGEGICINPFSSIHTLADLNEDLETLVTLVAQMAFPFGFGQAEMKDLAKSYEYRVIEEAITIVWQRLGAMMSIKDILDWFASQTDPRLTDVARQLRPWAYGRYAEWLVGTANIKFDNPLLVLELDDLAPEPELQAVVMNLVLAKIQREMYLNTAKELQEYGYKLPKLLIIDEAWNLLAKPNTGAFIESAYRRARKYQASIWIITQSFWDCERTAAARVALDNSNWIMGLMQDIGPLKQAIEKGLLDLSEYALQLMSTLQKTDNYSELYLINKSVRGEGLYRLIVDPASYWTYTTKGDERAKLELLMAQGLSIEQAIDKLANESDLK